MESRIKGEYTDYRIDVRLLSPVGTPWHSDTIMGLLSWAVALGEGDAGVRGFLEPFLAGSPPFLVSDGFPYGRLPNPLIPIKTAQHYRTAEEASLAKKRKMASLLTTEDFDLVRRGERPYGEPLTSPWRQFQMLHAAIDRTTWSTSGQGNLFTTVTQALPDNHGRLSVFVRAQHGWIERVERLFGIIAQTGFGRDKSTGCGSFELERVVTQPRLFENFPGANGFISISSWTPLATDPVDGYWRLKIKRGKLGEGVGSDNPFKYPLIQFTAGSVFRTGHTPAPFYGRTIRNIAPGFGEAVQICYCLAVPCACP
jgi:CRISPR-associated protein Csm4